MGKFLMQSILARLIPFIFLGVMIVLLVAGMIIFSYLLIVGALVGLILFMIAWVRDRLFGKKKSTPSQLKDRPGRTIDHHDL